MYTKKKYGFWLTFNWSKKPFIIGIIYGLIVTVLYIIVKEQLDVKLVLPWNPIGQCH